MRLLIITGSLALLAGFLFLACDSSDDDSADSDSGSDVYVSDTEQLFLQTINRLNEKVAQYGAETSPVAGFDGYYRQARDDLDELDSLYDRMVDQCTESAYCEPGGGATGNVEGSCLWGGHMMDGDRMHQMRLDLDGCRQALNDLHERCAEAADPEACAAARDEHVGLMRGFLGELHDRCANWWDDGQDADNGNHHHWGDCDVNHHGDGHDDDHMGMM